MEAELKAQLDRIEQLTLLSQKTVLSVKDAARLTGRTEKSIRNRLPEIPHYKGPMGICILRTDLEQYMCAVKIVPVSHLMR